MKTFTGMKLFLAPVLALSFVVSCGENKPAPPGTGGHSSAPPPATKNESPQTPTSAQPPAPASSGPLQKTATIALLVEAEIGDTVIKNCTEFYFRGSEDIVNMNLNNISSNHGKTSIEKVLEHCPNGGTVANVTELDANGLYQRVTTYKY